MLRLAFAPILIVSLLAGCGARTSPSLSASQGPPGEPADASAPVESDAGVAKVSASESDGDVAAAPAEEPFVNPVRTDWPIFLGPHGNGTSDETGLVDSWPEEGPPVLWDRKIGTGYSSPSIRGERLVVHHRQDDKDVIECLRADDGAFQWKYEYDTDFTDPYGYNNGPRCSPLLTETLCYTYGAQGRLICLELATGKLIWERDTARDWKVPGHFFGAGCTPILEGDLLIVLVGGAPNSAVVAFDAATGETKWESVGKETWDGVQSDDPEERPLRWTSREMLVSYSSPIAATIHGKRHVLCLVRQGLVSLDPATGAVRFKYWFRAPLRTNESVNAARPVVFGDRIFLSAAYETGMALLKVHADSAGYDVVWRDRQGMATHWSTAIYDNGCLYGFSGRHENEGMLQCIDAESGKLLWQTSGYEGDFEQLAPKLQVDRATGLIRNSETGKTVAFPMYGRGSATFAEGKHFILGERGTLALAKLNRDGWKEICRSPYNRIRYPRDTIWASPVLSHGRLYLRSEAWLTCFNVSKPIAR